VLTVSVTDIAREVGIHKSAVLRYFETREEIFLDLTATGWREWARVVAAELDEAGVVTEERLAAALSGTLAAQPLFCELLSHAALHLERNVSLDAVREFKLAALAALDELVATLARVQPQLGATGGRDLIAAVVALAASLWQTAHPPETLAALYVQDSRLGHAVVEFEPRLRRLIGAVIRGLATG
jgi:AcrR family transcriptional regulator